MVAKKKEPKKGQASGAWSQKDAELNSFINNISDIAWIKDAESKFIAVNRAFCDAVGMEPEALINKTCRVCLPEEEARRFREEDLEVMAAGTQKIVEEKIVETEEIDVWIEKTKSPIFDESEKVIGTVGVARNITKRKKTEEELFYKNLLLDAQSQTFLDGLLVIDNDGKVVSSNDRMREMWKVPREIWDSGDDEVLLRHAVSMLKHPDEFLEKVRYLYDKRDEKSRDEIELRDGRYFDRYSSPLIDSNMNYYGRIWFFRDITDRKKAEQALEKLNVELEERVELRTAELSKANQLLESKMEELKQAAEALRESEEKFRSMMESMKDAAYITSADFRIEYMNPQMIRRIGRDATGETCWQVIYDRNERCPWCVKDRILEGKCAEYELENPGDNRHYAITNTPIFHSGGPVSKLTIFRDTTEKKAIEAQLHQARKMESIGIMAGGIAHDFNNILYIILGNAELALEEIPEWNPLHSSIKDIRTSSLRAAGIVSQLLNFSRKTDQALKPIGAVTVITDTLKFLRSTTPSFIDIRKNLPEEDITIRADPVQINQVLMNITTNAVQAMEETGGILEITVEKEFITKECADHGHDLAPGEYMKIIISDTGPGIDPKIMDRVFDPYFTTKEVGKGSGMGLAVVHGSVINHGGTIAVESEPGKGTTFTIFFPVIHDEPTVEIRPVDTIPHGNERLLFIDDEEAIVELAQSWLEKLGYRVETKMNPVEALQLYQSDPHQFDLVITDMTMPDMTGVQLFEKLREIRSSIPVIICTGHSTLLDEEEAKRLGIDEYVMKPIAIRQLAAAVRRVLDRDKGPTS